MAKSRNLHFGLEITKVDEELRLVEGFASADNKDRQGDRIPYEVMVDTMKADAETLGIREMHQPKAIGVLKNWWGDESNRRIGVQIFLSKSKDGEDALTKVKEGVLKGFSIGGRALDWVYEGSTRIIRKMSLTEISLVDVPANPQAVITLVKSQTALDLEARRQQTQKKSMSPSVTINNFFGGSGNGATIDELEVENEGESDDLIGSTQVDEPSQERGFTHFPDVPTVPEDMKQGTQVAVDLNVSENVAEVTPDNIGSVANQALDEATKLVEVGYGQGIDKFVDAVKELKSVVERISETKKSRVEELSQIGKVVGIMRRPDSPTEPQKGFSQDSKKYGDPANFGFPCDTEFNALSSVKLYNIGKGMSSYSPREWAVLGRRICRISQETIGVKFTYDPIHKRVEKEKSMETKLEKASVAGLLDEVKGVVNSAIEAIGSDPEKAKDMLTQALSALEVGADTATSTATATGAQTPVSTETGVAEVKGEGTAVVTVTPPSAPTATEKTAATPTQPETTVETLSAPSTPSTPSASATDETMEKFTGAFREVMKDFIDELKKSAAPVALNAPAGDIPTATLTPVNPVEAALVQGNVRKAMEEIGDGQSIYAVADDLVKQAIVKSGISMNKFFVLGVPPGQEVNK